MKYHTPWYLYKYSLSFLCPGTLNKPLVILKQANSDLLFFFYKLKPIFSLQGFWPHSVFPQVILFPAEIKLTKAATLMKEQEERFLRKLFAVISYIIEMFLLKLEKVKYMFYKISESVKFTRIPFPCIPLNDLSKWH